MSTVEQAEALVAKMTRGEKAELLQHVARDLGDAYEFVLLARLRAGSSAKGVVAGEMNSLWAATAGERPLTDLESVADEATTPFRARVALLAFASGLSAPVAIVGICSGVVYLVRARRRDFAVRTALGASQRSLGIAACRLVLPQISLGAVVGLAAAYALNRLVAHGMFGVSAGSPSTYLVAVAGLLFIAVVVIGVAVRVARTNSTWAILKDA